MLSKKTPMDRFADLTWKDIESIVPPDLSVFPDQLKWRKIWMRMGRKE